MRFLACLLYLPNGDPHIQGRVYPLNKANSPEEVTYPEETIAFAFLEANSADDALSCILFRLPKDNSEIYRFQFPAASQKLYVIGRKVLLNGCTFVKNPHSGVFIPFDNRIELIPE